MNDAPEPAPQPETSGDVLTTIFEPIPPATGGTYVFTSQWDALRTTLAKFGPRSTSVTARSHRRKPRTFKAPKVASPIPVRIVIYPDRVKFEAKIDLALIGSVLPTVGPIEGFSERSEPLCFVFDLNVLLRAASNIPGEGMMTLPDGRRVWVWGSGSSTSR
jgi:hypothetical protein